MSRTAETSAARAAQRPQRRRAGRPPRRPAATPAASAGAVPATTPSGADRRVGRRDPGGERRRSARNDVERADRRVGRRASAASGAEFAGGDPGASCARAGARRRPDRGPHRARERCGPGPTVARTAALGRRVRPEPTPAAAGPTLGRSAATPREPPDREPQRSSRAGPDREPQRRAPRAPASAGRGASAAPRPAERRLRRARADAHAGPQLGATAPVSDGATALAPAARPVVSRAAQPEPPRPHLQLVRTDPAPALAQPTLARAAERLAGATGGAVEQGEAGLSTVHFPPPGAGPISTTHQPYTISRELADPAPAPSTPAQASSPGPSTRPRSRASRWTLRRCTSTSWTASSATS